MVCVMFVGFVTWKEFHIHFLLAKGYKQNETLQHVEDYESLNIEAEGEWFLLIGLFLGGGACKMCSASCCTLG